jgi:hypothetical protein
LEGRTRNPKGRGRDKVNDSQVAQQDLIKELATGAPLTIRITMDQ